MARPRAAKQFPPSRTSGETPAGENDVVMGGSLTRSTDGRLQTLQTHGMYPSPTAVQEVWANASRRRYRKTWEGRPLGSYGHVIEWEPREVTCGRCGRSLGSYVGYRVRYPDGHLDRERGIVEDTSPRYERNASAVRGAGSRGPKSQPRFRLGGEIGRRASKTSACFRCPGCKAEFKRNLSTLGRQFFEDHPDTTFVLE